MHGKIRELYQKQAVFENDTDFITASMVTPFIEQPPGVKYRLNEVVGLTAESWQALWESPTNPRGPLRLRELIAEMYAKEDGLVIPPSNVIITYGATHAISVILGSLFTSPIVSSTAPFYPGYQDIVGANKGTFVCIDWDSNNQTMKIPKCDVFLFSDPSNPSGEKLTKESLLTFCSLLSNNDILPIVDEAYRDYAPRVHCWAKIAGSEILDKTFFVGSTSKSFVASPNLRLGWIACRNKDLIDRIAHYIYGTVSSVSSLSAGIMEEVLRRRLSKTCHETIGWERQFVDKQAKRINFISNFTHPFVTIVGKPDIGLFCLIRIIHSSFGDDMSFCNHLLQEEKVGLLPGSIFGLQPSMMYLRVSMGIKFSKLRIVFDRIARYASKTAMKIN